MPDPKYFSSAALSAYLQYPYKFKLLYIDRVGTTYKNHSRTMFKISDLELRITVVQQLEKLMNMLIKHCIMQKT